MADVTDKAKAFFCVLQNKGRPLPDAFQIGPDLKAITAWTDNSGKVDPPDNTIQVGDKPETNNNSLSGLMKKISDSSHHQYEMIMLLTMARSVFPQSLARVEIVDKPLGEMTPLVKTDNYTIFELDENKLGE